jgi:predicted O-methyltransferase YrrM
MKIRDWLTSIDPRAKSWHPKVIHQIAVAQEVKSYLEVGIYRGETLRRLARHCEFVVGVDIDEKATKSIRPNERLEIFLGTVQEYSNSRSDDSRMFDLAFIDANHLVDFVIQDFDTVTQLMEKRGTILLHDTWPKSEEYADPKYCGDAYKAVDLLRQKYGEWNFVTIRKHPGLTIAQRVGTLPSWVKKPIVPGAGS